MHLLKGHTVLISPADSKLIDSLKMLGVNVIETKPIEHLIEYERYHADMQLFIIDDCAFISIDSIYLSRCLKDNYNVTVVKDLKYNYPDNVLLNVVCTKNKLLCRVKSVAPEILDYAEKHNVEIINTRQGYTKCSTLVLKTGAIITADVSIYKAATKCGVKSLLISSGHIYLDDNNYGFIGGASGVIGDTVLFFGDINTHPDSKSIINFIAEEDMDYISLMDGTLKDVGGLIQIN